LISEKLLPHFKWIFNTIEASGKKKKKTLKLIDLIEGNLGGTKTKGTKTSSELDQVRVLLSEYSDRLK
jgi:hypothetical protein